MLQKTQSLKAALPQNRSWKTHPAWFSMECPFSWHPLLSDQENGRSFYMYVYVFAQMKESHAMEKGFLSARRKEERIGIHYAQNSRVKDECTFPD